MQYITFYVGETLYGFSIYAVREITRFQKITPVQGADRNIDGLMNLRGQIVCVMNLGICLNMEPVPQEKHSRFLILKSDEELSSDAFASGISTSRDNVALLVNRIGEVINVDKNEVDPSPAHVSDEYISGVI